MNADEIAARVLHQSMIEKSERRRYAHSITSTWRTSVCPACGQGLKRKVAHEETLLYCMNCSFLHHVPFVMDEARSFGEPYLPGVTGRVRPNLKIEWRRQVVR